jgi:lysophospholipase L1-like esterase
MGVELTRAGAIVQINARVGRSANNFWGREDTAAQLAAIRAFEPDLAIIELGTNDLGLSMAVDRQQMLKIRDALAASGAKVYAFGPPSFASSASSDQAVDVISMMTAVFGGRFIDLRPLTIDMVTKDRADDGVHFTAAGGTILGQRMADSFESFGGSTGHVVLAIALVVAAWSILR